MFVAFMSFFPRLCFSKKAPCWQGRWARRTGRCLACEAQEGGRHVTFSGCVPISGGRKVMESFPMPSGIGFCKIMSINESADRMSMKVAKVPATNNGISMTSNCNKVHSKWILGRIYFKWSSLNEINSKGHEFVQRYTRRQGPVLTWSWLQS